MSNMNTVIRVEVGDEVVECPIVGLGNVNAKDVMRDWLIVAGPMIEQAIADALYEE